MAVSLSPCQTRYPNLNTRRARPLPTHQLYDVCDDDLPSPALKQGSIKVKRAGTYSSSSPFPPPFVLLPSYFPLTSLLLPSSLPHPSLPPPPSLLLLPSSSLPSVTESCQDPTTLCVLELLDSLISSKQLPPDDWDFALCSLVTITQV